MTLFAVLAKLSEVLAGENSRLKKRAAIAETISSIQAGASSSNAAGEDAGLFAMYLAGTPFAESDARKLNVGGALLSKAVKTVSHADDAALTAAYRRHGDLGAAAADLWPHRPQETLSLVEVQDAFAGMAVARTTAVRAALAEGLLQKATTVEAKYLLKLMLGDMRIGVKQSLVEEAIASAASVDVKEVRRAVMLEGDLAAAVAMAFRGGLGEAKMRLFHPLGFMLASPVENPEEAVARFTAKPVLVTPKKAAKKTKAGSAARTRQSSTDDAAGDTVQDESSMQAYDAGPDRLPGDSAMLDGRDGVVEAFLEDKYDGMRAQVHCGVGARVAIYSRNKEDITESFPELVGAFSSVRDDAGGLILDGEILGWDFSTGQALPFAVMGQRIGRKKVPTEMLRSIPAVFMAFDLLYAGGDLLLERPLKERRNLLEGVVERLGTLETLPVPIEDRRTAAQADLFSSESLPNTESMARLMLSPTRLVGSAEEIDRAYAAARARANEGVMLKSASSSYQPGRRGLAWVKLKRELATLDVVITGAEFGSGRRAGVLSDYTFAVRGPEFHANGELLNVGKAYSGITDTEVAELSAWMFEHTLEDHGHSRSVEPIRVLEVAFDNIMRSERHASGFAMRFPRILRIRDDKPLDEIDSVERVEEIYQSQVDKPVE